jgi:hypothetical protein
MLVSSGATRLFSSLGVPPNWGGHPGQALGLAR